ncbi:MAG TPA: hypothetical protein VI341_11045, partial [Actinomycetota bacterium]
MNISNPWVFGDVQSIVSQEVRHGVVPLWFRRILVRRSRRRSAQLRRTIAVAMLSGIVVSVPVGHAAATRSGPDDAPLTPAQLATPATPDLIAADVERGEISEAQGALFLASAFSDPAIVPMAYRSTTPWDGTLPLLRLRRTLQRLPAGPAARKAKATLRAATFACPGANVPVSKVRTSAHFYLQYRNIRGRLSAKRYTDALETTWKTEVRRFGWARPPRDPVSSPPGRRYPVRVQSLQSGLYGYVTATRKVGNNPATPWRDKDAFASCMVLNDDFRGFPSSPKDSLSATVAHEFNHSLQFGYGALIGPKHAADVYTEGGASWMEDEVFDGSNDNYYYLWPTFTSPMPLYAPGFPYPYWVVFRAITEHVAPSGQAGGGEDVMQSFWEQISRGTATNSSAMNRALQEEGTTLGKAYHDAAIALRFSRGCGQTETRFCLEEGPSYVAIAGPNSDTASIGSVGAQLTDEKIANDFAL